MTLLDLYVTCYEIKLSSRYTFILPTYDVEETIQWGLSRWANRHIEGFSITKGIIELKGY